MCDWLTLNALWICAICNLRQFIFESRLMGISSSFWAVNYYGELSTMLENFWRALILGYIKTGTIFILIMKNAASCLVYTLDIQLWWHTFMLGKSVGVGFCWIFLWHRHVLMKISVYRDCIELFSSVYTKRHFAFAR